MSPFGPARSMSQALVNVSPSFETNDMRAIIDRLYPDSPGNNQKRATLLQLAKATSAALRLADEFVAVFGRPALDDLVLRIIPDEDYAPGEVHRAVLELPWADVLTTNYD